MLRKHTDLGWVRIHLDEDHVVRIFRGDQVVHRAPTVAIANRWLRRHKASPIALPKELDDNPVEFPISAERMAEMALPGFDERGWHGGGQQRVTSTQRRNPRKGNTRNGKRAHKLPYGPGRTW